MGTEMAERLIDEKRDNNTLFSPKLRTSRSEQMKSVSVLDLSRAEISSLPKSLSEMNHLRALVLYGCTRLKSLPSLANLKRLQLLDLSHTAIEELPHGTEELVSLRRLRLSHTSRLKMLRAGALQKLASLEELLMHESGWVWSSSPGVQRAAGSDEIASIKHLYSLQAQFRDWPDLVTCMSAKHRTDLKQFHLSAGFWGTPSTRGDNAIVLSGCDLALVDPSSSLLPENTLRIVLKNCNLLGLISLSTLQRLKECSLKSCRQIQSLASMEDCQRPILPALESLELSQMPDLSVLYRGPVAHGTFGCLRTLALRHCHRVTSLFSIDVLRQLRCLQSLVVVDCCRIEEVVMVARGDEVDGEICRTVGVPQLRTLVLRDLPRLKSVCGLKLVCESLVSIEVDHCPALKKLPLADDYVPPNLRIIYGSRTWWSRLQWSTPCNCSLLLPLLHPLYQEVDEMEEEDEDEEKSSLEEELDLKRC